MKYNKIYLPLRVAAFVLAGVICIIGLCSFGHPFDVHTHVDEYIEKAKDEAERYHEYMIEKKHLDHESRMPNRYVPSERDQNHGSCGTWGDN